MLVLDRSAGEVVAELTVKRSRFIATLAPVDSEDEFAALVGRIRSAATGSRHTCWAVVVGSDPGQIVRCSDDGEPAGTAGPPILAALTSREVVNAGIVVVRYYGGIQLGTGGLIRAYGGTAAAALDAAPLRKARAVTLLRLNVPTPVAGRVGPVLHAAGDVRSTDYGTDGVLFAVDVATSSVDHLCDRVQSLSAGETTVVEATRRMA